MDSKLKQYVIDSFSSANSIKKYSNDAKNGLWESEKILISKYFLPNSSVLDLGCGVGRTTFPLAVLGYKVVGVDVTPAFIDLATEELAKNDFKIDLSNIAFKIGDATNLDLPDNSFDNVLFSFNGWSMIPTKEARLEAAKEVYRVLKQGGTYIFCTHKRQIFGQELIWLTQFVRLKLLKPLGYKTKETDFGDYYFRKDSETTYPIEQFVNIMDVQEVKKLYEDLGFKVELMQMRSEITDKDGSLKSGDVMFFVCKKS